jgi:hypothetical protein
VCAGSMAKLEVFGLAYDPEENGGFATTLWSDP